jgi:hypothetical protein
LNNNRVGSLSSSAELGVQLVTLKVIIDEILLKERTSTDFFGNYLDLNAQPIGTDGFERQLSEDTAGPRLSHRPDGTVFTVSEASMRGRFSPRGPVRLLDERGATIADLCPSVREMRAERQVERAQEAEERRRLLTCLTDRRPWWRRWLR